MSRKKKTTSTPNTNTAALHIGSRLRCTDDGVEGRIVWANGTSVKIRWNDGEQVTWRRDALAGKLIELLDPSAASNEDPQTEAPAEVSASEPNVATELPKANPEEMCVMVEQVPATEASAESPPQTHEPTQAATEGSVSDPASATIERTEAASADSAATSSAHAQPKRQRKTPGQPKVKKLSALDAAAQVLAEEGRAMTCQGMIDVMAAKGYWTSPQGATPQATLYSAILRERNIKGSAARFEKVERGKFARNTRA
jgi:hypothetical protein